MRELELFSTRLSKGLKDRVSSFSKKQGVTIQKFTEYAFEKTLKENKNIKSAATVFMQKKLLETSEKLNEKAHELIGEILFQLENGNNPINSTTKEMIEQYEHLLKQEEIALSFYEDTIIK